MINFYFFIIDFKKKIEYTNYNPINSKLIMKKIIITISLFLLLVSNSFSEESILINENLSKNVFTHKVEYLRDPSGKLSENKITKKNLKWQHIAGETCNFGYTPDTFWFRFKVINTTKKAINWYLEIAYPMLDSVTLYVPNEKGGFDEKNSGDYIAFSRREVRDRNPIFPLAENPGSRTYYFKVKTTSVVSFATIGWSHIESRNSITRDYAVLWIYYGIMIIMVLYNLFIFMTVRDISYLYYVLFIASLILLQLILNGFAFQYLWPDNIWWANNSLPFFVCLASVGYLQFFRHYLQTRERSRIIDWIVLILLAPSIAWLPSPFLNNYAFSIKIAMGIVFINQSSLIIFSIILTRRGYREAKVYLISFIGLVIGVTLFQLRSFGFLPHNFATNWSIQIGSSFMVVLLSLGLADKIKMLKDNLQELNIDLEQKVTERTRKLVTANKKLKEMDKLKSNFFANISHEIRTPLTLILSPIESLIQGDFGKNINKQFFINIQKNAVRLLKLINNLLDFSKIEAGKMVLKISRIDVVKFLNNYISTVQSTAESRNISIRFSNRVKEFFIHADIEKLDRIIMNLLSNALKFTEKGGAITITLSEENGFCSILVKDTGIGIPMDKQEIIFDRFAQADSSSTRKYEGTGLGLSLVKELVEMHSGSVEVKSRHISESADRHGTTFKVLLPIEKEMFNGRTDIEFIEKQKTDDSSRGGEAFRFNGMREMLDISEGTTAEKSTASKGKDDKKKHMVLVVDDNIDMCKFLRSILEKHYEVETAENGIEGFKMAKSLMPNIIISDVMMPELNGYEMTEMIKKDTALRGIPIILLTAKANITDKIDGFEYGADDYLIKPFNSKELLARIKSLIKARENEQLILQRNIEIERDLSIARQLQANIIPKENPVIPGYMIHSIYLPMEKVGGDLYTIIENTETIEIFIADVSGHGLTGAFLSMMTKVAIESIPARNSPMNVQESINNIICKSTVHQNFVTSFYGIIDKKTNTMKYCNAGHFPPIVYRQESQNFFDLHTKGNPLGWFENINLNEGHFKFEKGDRFVLYTDGIIECIDSLDKEFGDDRFKEHIKQYIKSTPEDFTQNLVNTLYKISGKKKFDDDVCMVVIDILS